jgi:hypothetical protein
VDGETRHPRIQSKRGSLIVVGFEPLDHFVNSEIVNLEHRPTSSSLQVPNRERD